MYRCRVDPSFPSVSNLYHRCLYITCCFWYDSHSSQFLLKHNSNPIPLIALAAVSCLRSLCGFGFPLFVPAMYAKLGYGKGDTILACCAILLGCPAYVPLGPLLFLISLTTPLILFRPFFFWTYGRRIRMASKYAHKPQTRQIAEEPQTTTEPKRSENT